MTTKTVDIHLHFWDPRLRAVKANPRLKKVLLWCSFEVAHVDWGNDSRVWELSLPLSASPSWGPDGLSMVQECAGAVPAPADRTPLRSAAAARMKRIVWVDTQWQELMRSSTSVTAFISYTTAIDSLAGVTLVTLSFNLLQRAWPGEHISRGGREQTLGCPKSKWKRALSPAAVPRESPRPQQSSLICGMFCFAHSVKGDRQNKSRSWSKKGEIARRDCATPKKEKEHLPKLTYLRKQRLTYCFLTDIWNFRRTSIRALSHSALRNSNVLIALSDHFDILFQEQCRVDASPTSSLPAKLKVILREWKLMWAINFLPLTGGKKKSDTFQPDTF